MIKLALSDPFGEFKFSVSVFPSLYRNRQHVRDYKNRVIFIKKNVFFKHFFSFRSIGRIIYNFTHNILVNIFNHSVFFSQNKFSIRRVFSYDRACRSKNIFVFNQLMQRQSNYGRSSKWVRKRVYF